MADINLQFHATPEELAEVVVDAAAEPGVHMVGVALRPYSAIDLAPTEARRAVLAGRFDRIVFMESPLGGAASSAADLAGRFRGGLVLELGRSAPGSLTESRLAAASAYTPINPAWRRIAARVRALTSAGAVAVDPATGASTPAPHLRFTEGARRRFLEGAEIRQAVGSVVFRLGDES